MEFKNQLKDMKQMSFSFGDDEEDESGTDPETDAKWNKLRKSILANKYKILTFKTNTGIPR